MLQSGRVAAVPDRPALPAGRYRPIDCQSRGNASRRVKLNVEPSPGTLAMSTLLP
jgi:hypothetical protein